MHQKRKMVVSSHGLSVAKQGFFLAQGWLLCRSSGGRQQIPQSLRERKMHWNAELPQSGRENFIQSALQ